MKLIMIGGASASRLADLLKSSADNVDITVHNSLYSFIEAASLRSIPVDRLFLLEDALKDLTTDRQTQLESFARFLESNYPQIRAFFMAKSEDVLHEMANIFSAYNYLTLSIRTINVQFVQDVALQPLESVATRYANCVIKADGVDIISNSAAAPEKPKPKQEPEASKKEKRGLFGRRKPTNNVGNSPTAPLSPSQSKGFGFTSQNPSGSNMAGAGNNGFNINPGNTNPFASAAQGNVNPFAQPQGNTNPFAMASQSGADTSSSGTDNAQSGADNAQAGVGNTNPFGTPSVGGQENTNPFAMPSGGGQDNTNPFAMPSQSEADNTNPFATPSDNASSQGNVDEFGAPIDNTPFENTPEEITPYQANAFSQEVEEIEEIDEVNPAQMNNFFGTTPNSLGGFDVPPTTENPTQNTMNFGVDNSQNSPSQTPIQGQNPAQGSPNFGAGNPFGGYSGVSDLGENSISESPDDQSVGAGTSSDFSQNFDPYNTQTGYSDSQDIAAPQQVDMSRLHARETQNQYDFKSAQTVRVNRQTSGRQALEEASAISTAPVAGMMIDDSAYQAQFAPAPQVVEKIVEREVYIDSGTETPAQKLLDMGKQVTIVVTGDRRSGVTYSAITLASLYGRKYSTLLIDLDSETCGGQLYQDIEVLANEDENVQNGVKRAKNPTLLGNLVHHDADANYDYLFSMMGNEPITDLEIRNLCSALNAQRQFQLVIIDCPWKRLNCLDEVLMSAKVMICVDADISGCYNIVRMLGDQPVGNRITSAIERAGGYVAKFGTSTQNLTQNMAWIHETFNDDSTVDWTALRILGTSDQKGLVEVMKKL